MRQIRNEEYSDKLLKGEDIFICAFGYEKRSTYLFERILGKIKDHNILVFYFDEYDGSVSIDKLIDSGILCVKSTYSSGEYVQDKICEFIRNNKKDMDGSIHIDYSSMPRNWYYNLPILLDQDNKRVYFWYVVGEYQVHYTEYPTAGIDSYKIIGKPSLRTEGKRLHVFGLSYDFVRTKALISELDPDTYITCNAFDSANSYRENNVNELNEQILSKAINELSFCFNDFSFMFSKLCEVANEHSNVGSVIFVPDGPKPLIFAMSLVALYLDKVGISCLHIYRNEQCKSNVSVTPTDTILGFSI